MATLLQEMLHDARPTLDEWFADQQDYPYDERSNDERERQYDEDYFASISYSANVTIGTHHVTCHYDSTEDDYCPLEIRVDGKFFCRCHDDDGAKSIVETLCDVIRVHGDDWKHHLRFPMARFVQDELQEEAEEDLELLLALLFGDV
jgi:hypothetical protein